MKTRQPEPSEMKIRRRISSMFRPAALIPHPSMNMKFPKQKTFLAVVTLMVLFLGLVTAAKAQTLTHRYSFNDPAGSQTFADSLGGHSC
jgi:hypothetical protein